MSIHWHDDEIGWCPCDEPAPCPKLVEGRDAGTELTTAERVAIWIETYMPVSLSDAQREILRRSFPEGADLAHAWKGQQE